MDFETRLRFALYRYGSHHSSCPGKPCNCGFKAEWDAAGLPATVGDAWDIALLRKSPKALELPHSTPDKP